MDLYEMPFSSIIRTRCSGLPSATTLNPQPRKRFPGVRFTTAFMPFFANTDLALFAYVTEAKAMMCLFNAYHPFFRQMKISVFIIIFGFGETVKNKITFIWAVIFV